MVKIGTVLFEGFIKFCFVNGVFDSDRMGS